MERAPLPLSPTWQAALAATPQNPRFHAEGDVLTHTQMVVDQFFALKDSFSLSPEEMEILYWAAVLHDIGKPATAIFEEGRWRSPGHERVGTPIAMDLLIQTSPLGPSGRRKVLDLVRWHGFTLRWAKFQWDHFPLYGMAVRTDLRLLGIFGLMDFLGRISEDHAAMATRLRRLVDTEIPKIEYLLGGFSAIQSQYLEGGIQQKNALWGSAKMERPELLEKLLHAPSTKTGPRKKIYVTIGPPLSGKTHWIQQNLSQAFWVDLEPYLWTEGGVNGEFDIDRKVVELRYFVSIYLRNHQEVVLEGRNLDPRIRLRLNELLRELDAELIYLQFESSLETLMGRNLNLSQPLSEDFIRERYHSQELIHPWEAHRLEWIPEKI